MWSRDDLAGWVEFEDGRKVSLAALRDSVPDGSYQADAHLRVCERLIPKSLPLELRPTLLNLVVTKSDAAGCVTALCTHPRGGPPRERIRLVSSPFVDEELRDLIGDEIEILPHENSNRALLPGATVFRLFQKTAAHRLFRLLSKRSNESRTIVRAWVDTSDRLYGERSGDACFLIYPFAGRIRRQWKYWRECVGDGREIRLAGLPYRFRDVLRVALAPKKRDELLAEIEACAYRAYGHELARMGVEEVLTTDEFEAGAHELYRVLADAGIHSTNRCHGIVTYGPCVHYDHLIFCTTAQAKYYGHHGEWKSCEVVPPLPNSSPRGASISAAPIPRAGDPCVIYVLGNWRPAGKLYEEALELRVIHKLRAACARLNVPLKLRGHPNLQAKQIRAMRRRFGIPVMPATSLHGIASRPIFVNLMSTAYYDLLFDGPTIFIEDDLLRPSAIFGAGLPCSSIEDLESEIKARLDEESWRTHLADQITKERG